MTDKKKRIDSDRISYIESDFLVDSSAATPFSLLLMYSYIFYSLWKISRYQLVILNISAIGNGFFAFLLSLFGSRVMIIAYAEEITIAKRTKGFKGLLKNYLC